MRRRHTLLLPLLGLPGLARAQSFPARPMRLIIPFAAGGSNDIIGRILIEGLATRLGQPVVVENRGGAGGILGNEVVASAAPDGHTLLLTGSGSFVSSGLIQPRVPYDWARGFSHIGYIGASPAVIAINPALPARTLAEFQALGKTRGQPMSYASPGVGTTGHVTGALIGQVLGIGLEHVPYRGTGPALQDVIAGRVDMISNAAAPLQPFLQAGTLRGIALAAGRRSDLLPNLATAAEQGFPAIDSATWFGLSTTGGSPAAAVTAVHAALNATLAEPDVRRRLLEQGLEPEPSPTPDDFARFVATERERWAAVIRTARITAE
ncbi:Bug family tripartite tricarboxylate transporter substrate binding protein [Rhodovarius lipocyclicus]|uniref:Bug family tripartite tricarboxylate transporter substrate binding protein n=1 Tax=Rhodovarius lipocyclicus TaxID=268410 RepID=UPI00135A8B37|nr:tripartite tricarboxylate transporter substrate-binding protein [Rhodovarius lipocyclicus]